MEAPASIIQKKRNGGELSNLQIREFIQGIATGEVADYQATAWLMAVYFQGMTPAETVALTEAMLESGDRYELSAIPGVKVDKHSTGGVGDKVSLILAPLAAACGLKVPMMAGRGLGHSGGTLDKLEAIRGFDVRLPKDRFERTLSQAGCVIVGQTDQMVPADKRLYALRDVTATIECVPLITASILSKKLAEGAEALVLDVKVGNGAFMKTKEQARKLARSIVAVSNHLGLKCRAVLTNMDQPLGYAVGNAVEVIECIEVLTGKPNASDPAGTCSADLKELTVQLCAQMLELGGISRNLTEGRKLARAKLADGSAWKVFQEMVRLQGGALDQIQDPRLFPRAERRIDIVAAHKGYVVGMDTECLGRCLVELGGGRKKSSDTVDHGVGMLFHKKLGARVQAGETLVTLLASATMNEARVLEIRDAIVGAISIQGARKAVPRLIHETIG